MSSWNRKRPFQRAGGVVTASYATDKAELKAKANRDRAPIVKREDVVGAANQIAAAWGADPVRS